MAELQDITIATTQQLQAAGFHHQTVERAVADGTIVKVAYGLYTSPDVAMDPRLGTP